jgi:DNA polymerase III subunit epsilon
MARLSELDILIIDCQTTGASPAHGVVLEIGWGVEQAEPHEAVLPLEKAGQHEATKHAGVRQLESHWVTLPEGQRVSSQVRRLTGFDPAKVASTLAPEAAWQRLRAALSGGDRIPTAIHFAKFELPFLREWAARFEPQAAFPLDVVCVHAIASRLYPDLPRRSIRALAGFLGHGLDPARRCLGHVEATAFIWRKLRGELGTRGIETWQELGAWLATPAPPRPKKRRYPMPSATIRALPDAPGVYRFLRSNGDVLYVGKATSLKKRVASHFRLGSATTERALEMLTQVHDIHATPKDSALEAALLENEEIKAIDPPYNIQLLDTDRHTWFFDQSLEACTPEPDATHRRGPVPSTFSVRALRAVQLLAHGEAPTPALCARALGTAERWAASDAVFHSGFARFMERHAIATGGDIDQTLLLVARRLLAAKPEVVAATPTDDLRDGSSTPDELAPAASWDPERVLRHLERGITHAHQLLQRARWLCLIYDSDVLFREPGSKRGRLLSVRAGRLSEAVDAPTDALQTTLPYRLRSERQVGFNRARYDRLRTLTTELKRILRDGGGASVRVRRRWLEGAVLAAWLRWV